MNASPPGEGRPSGVGPDGFGSQDGGPGDRWPAPSTSGRVLGDGWVVVLAVAAAGGALLARPVPWPVVVGAAVLALALRRPVVLVLAVLLATSLLAARAWAGLQPAAPGPVQGRAVLVGDPERMVSGTRALARLDGQRVELWAYGLPAAHLRRGLAGDVVELAGSRTARRPESIALDPWRRVVGRVEVTTVRSVRPGAWPFRLANVVHRRLDRGARSLPAADRALFAGLVLGDDRNQPPALRDAFAAVGLSHLLAVSGQNVAFVLAAAGPLLSRLRLRARFVTVVALLAFFATVTRFEPSVLRAVAMAGLAAGAALVGRPVPGLRVLGLAVVGLLLIDPLLVRAIGFQLSVLASAGILVLAPPLVRRLPVPAVMAPAVAVPLAAQLATAPLLASRAGGLVAVSVPANVLVGPAAGAVMTWGSSAGVLAGFLPAPLATVLTLPSRLLLWWISTVAVFAAGHVAFVIGVQALALGGSVAVVVLVWERHRTRAPTTAAGVAVGTVVGAAGPAAPGSPQPLVAPRPRRRAWAAVVAVTVVAAWVERAPPPQRPLPEGAALYRNGGDELLVLARPVDAARLLGALRGRVVAPIELLIVTSSSAGAWRAAVTVIDRYRPEVVVAAGSRPATTAVHAGDVYRVGGLRVEVREPGRAGSGNDGPLSVVVTGEEDGPP